MFDSFLVALNAIMPTFLLLTFGYFLKHKNFVSSEFLKQTNTLTFKFFLPFLLFNNIYKTEITEAIDGMTFTIAVGSLLLLFAVLCIVVPRVVREPKQRGVIIQGIFRSNYVIFGVSLVTNVFGAEEAAAASILSAVLVPMYNVLAVIALTVFTGGGKVSLKRRSNPSRQTRSLSRHCSVCLRPSLNCVSRHFWKRACAMFRALPRRSRSLCSAVISASAS